MPCGPGKDRQESGPNRVPGLGQPGCPGVDFELKSWQRNGFRRSVFTIGEHVSKNSTRFGPVSRVVRTTFLLRYLNDAELRRVIQAATNKSEAFNGFVQWLFFGGERLIAENDRDRQRKLIKYNHLVANCLIIHNVQAQTRILRQLAEEGEEFDEATLSRLSPYLTEHVNRFGKYTLNLDRDSAALDYTLELRPGLAPALATASV